MVLITAQLGVARPVWGQRKVRKITPGTHLHLGKLGWRHVLPMHSATSRLFSITWPSMANHPKPSGSESFGTWNMYCGDSSIVSQSQGAEDNVIEESMASGFLQKVPLYNLCSCSSLIVDAQGSDSTINESCSGRVPVFITYTSSSLSVNPPYGYSSLVY